MSEDLRVLADLRRGLQHPPLPSVREYNFLCVAKRNLKLPGNLSQLPTLFFDLVDQQRSGLVGNLLVVAFFGFAVLLKLLV